MTPIRIVTAMLSIVLVTAAARADEITDQIHSALEAYEQQDYQGAIGDLNYAVAQIQEILNAQNAQLLPEPLEGWTASEVENVGAAMAMLGGGTSMTRRYTRDSEELEINITANSPWIASMMQMMTNPMLMAGNPDLKPYRYKRINGMKETSDGRIDARLRGNRPLWGCVTIPPLATTIVSPSLSRLRS